ncbi:NYN domain-containing protein [Thermasporomyces composti]|uniref:Putative RNA-binding protein with PIN domain n=1 Tax=Thermasporomyces composti TaxID=696763 RepID=A0A3D9V082_THECX|nr:NYN domain-containing protein [Thermasporomyces composti]REF34889.1 putative RNA-binding protein with PIN domain [Thermasporomyces composti]
MSSEAAGSEETGEDVLSRPLPDQVRQRIVALASGAIDELEVAELPAGLRPFARFAPARRVRLAATPIAVAVDRDPNFRHRVADRLRRGMPDLAEAIREGRRPAAADPFDVVAAAYLLRPPGWTAVAEDVLEQLERESAAQASDREAETVARLREQLAAVREAARHERERLKAELAAVKEENATLRRTVRQARDRARSAEETAAQHARLLEEVQEKAAADVARAEAEVRRLRARLADAEMALESARRAVRESRDVASARLRLLLDTLVDAAQGLRRELALPPVRSRPADIVEATEPAPGPAVSRPEDAVSLELLLGLPQVHLVVDGYNVTKTAWPTLPLETQRSRLVTALGGVVAQTGAEVTCVFDGAQVTTPPQLSVPRGVRVRFSPAGVSADEVIRQIAAAEPPGRPVVVVSSDREVAEGVRRFGARPRPASELVRLLAR